MSFNVVTGRAEFDKIIQPSQRQQVLVEDMDEQIGEVKVISVERKPLEASFNPTTKRFKLIDPQRLYDPNNPRVIFTDEIPF